MLGNGPLIYTASTLLADPFPQSWVLGHPTLVLGLDVLEFAVYSGAVTESMAMAVWLSSLLQIVRTFAHLLSVSREMTSPSDTCMAILSGLAC